jgi:protease-4
MTVARILAVLLLSLSLAFAEEPAAVPAEKPTPEPAEKPLPQPTEKPVPKPVEPPVPGPAVPTDTDKDKSDQKPAPTTKPVVVPATRPSRTPATRPASSEKEGATQAKFPSAREMMAKLANQKKQQEQLAKVAYIDLNRPLSEKPVGFSLFGEESLTLQSILGRLHRARTQSDVRGVLINLGSTSFNIAQAQEIRDALVELRQAKKKTFVYSDSYDTASYIAATGAENICMLEGGEIMIPGVGLETMFAKGLLDKVGVKADYVQIGQYKGADEQYTRTEPSEQMRGELNKILDSLWSQIVDGISYHRTLPRQDVEDMINDVVLSGKVAKERRFVDHLIDQDGLRELLKGEFSRDVNLVHNYGLPRREPMDFSNPFALFSSLAKKPADTDKPKVAIIYAEGVIIDGTGGESIFGGSAIGSEDLRQALRMALRDDDVEAIVIRIDSPGGSASASEVMWQAARRAAAKKPMVISIGSMAASGGYYLASAGEHIFADPSAIVGSIGVVGGKFVMKDLYDKLGLRTETFTRGKNADLFSSNQPFTESQRRLVTNWMKQTYEQFTDRVLSTRNSKIKDIDEVAHGRIFLAKEARALGMVDELGGINSAVAHAAKQADLEAGEYEIRVFPPTRTIADFLMGGDQDAALPIRPQINIDMATMLRTLSPASAKMLSQQLQVLELFQKRPVVLVSPFVVSIR